MMKLQLKAKNLCFGAALLPIAVAMVSPASAQTASGIDPGAPIQNPKQGAPTAASPSVGSGPTGPAAQQTAAATESNTSDIIVTGSRISRPTLDSPIPVTTLSATDLTRAGNTNIGDILERLPALSASQTQASSLAGGATIGGTGLNILNLRNLGQDRTLVLVDGQRHVSSVEGQFLVDVNTIPTDLIERVDVVTGGSSAIYGSDAMAGVVNFVLKHNYDGATFNAEGGISSHGDRGTYKLSGLVGKNFAEGRGNIAVDLEYDRANPLYLTDRPSLTGAFAGRNQFQLVNEPGSGLPERTFLTGVHSFGYSDGGSFIPYVGTNTRACSDVAASCLPNGFPRVFLFQPNGSLTEANYGTDFRPVGSGNNQNGDGSTLENTGVLQPGYKRYIANILAHYDVSDAFKPYFEGKFVRIDSYQTSSPTFTQGGPQGPGETPEGLGFFTETPIMLDNAFLTPQARSVITSLLPAGSDFFNINRNNVDLGSRGEKDRRDTYRFVAGVKGDFNDDWHYDVAVDYGHLRTHYEFTNNRIEENFYNAIDAVRNATGQIVCRINQVTVTDPSCQPLDILGFGGGQQTLAQRQAALNYINTTSQYHGFSTELDVNANIQGSTAKFLNLPGGPIRFAFGGEYRRETAGYHYDDMVTNGDTFLNAIAPFTPPAFKVEEGYAEVDVPILKDKPFFQELSLSGAGRVAHYNGSVGTVWAYNGAAVYAPIRDIRFRVNYSHSVRAPTLFDLYNSPSQNFASVDDPCDPNFINAGSPTRAANCAAAGVPANYAAPQTRAGSLQILTGGNPSLKAETSRSWTYGVVLQPRFVPGLSVTIDYYDIKIDKVISPVDAQTILNGCYDATSLNNAFCALINPRNADGTFQLPALLQSTLNYSAERSKGIDVDIAYNHRFTPNDKIAFRFIGNWVRFRDDYPFIDTPSQPDQVKGELGTPIYQFNASLDYTHSRFTLGYQLRFIGRQSIAQWEEQHEVAGLPGTPYDPLYLDKVYYPNVVYHDIRASFDLNNRFSLYGGVDNLTNKMPPYGLLGNGGAGLTAGETTNTDGLYDNIGRFMYVGVRVKI
jgi:outer membrane receptor protein involved in Fe transport